MLDDPRIITTIIVIAVVAIIPGWLIRMWLNRNELRRIMDRMTSQPRKDEKNQ